MSIFIHHGHSSLEIQQSTANKIELPELSALLEKLKSSDPVIHLQTESTNPERLLKPPLDGFVWLEAAGGLIENPSGEILLIYRRGAWDLPKGKIDSGETPELAAIREIEEETGLTHLTQVAELPPTYHIYQWESEWIFKKTHWFRYQLSEPQTLTLQREEDIEEAKWLKTTDMSDYWDRIYPSLRPLIRLAMG